LEGRERKRRGGGEERDRRRGKENGGMGKGEGVCAWKFFTNISP